MHMRQHGTVSFYVPTLAETNGDFSQMTDSLGRLQVLYDPLSTTAKGARTPFVGNVIPKARENADSAYFFGMTPLPTTNDNNLVAPNWYGPLSAPDNRFNIAGRVDHRISNKDALNVVFGQGCDNRVSPAGNSFGGGGGAVGGMEYNTGVGAHIAGWQYYRTPQKNMSL